MHFRLKATFVIGLITSSLLLACTGQSVNSGSTSALSSAAPNAQMPSGMPPGGPGFGGPGGPGGQPGGLPPNIEEIRAKYPELATALEEMQSLSPEERRSKLDTLFTEHPEYREALMPPAGMGPGGPGGPGETPPSGFPSGRPPQPGASASPAN